MDEVDRSTGRFVHNFIVVLRCSRRCQWFASSALTFAAVFKSQGLHSERESG